MSKASIVQADVVTAYGWGMAPLWEGLMRGRSAISPINPLAECATGSKPAAVVPGLSVPAGQSRVRAMLDRLLAPLAGKLAAHTPLILATTVGEIEFLQQAATAQDTDALTLARQADPQVMLAHIKATLGLTGRAWVVSCACASSTTAAGLAADMIQRDEASSVLVVAADALSEFVGSGFAALSSLDDQPARPFDANRAGLTLGEAAAWMILTSTDDTSNVFLAGWGSSSDASHMTAPDPAGRGLQRAITRACAMARCDVSQAAFIAAHGTATQYSDAMEMAAFSALVPDPRPVFSIKGGIGHTLGAAGLVQLLVTRQAMVRRTVPPTVGLVKPDDDALGRASDKPIALPSPDGRPLIALSTNSGFGGVNSALVLQMGGRP